MPGPRTAEPILSNVANGSEGRRVTGDTVVRVGALAPPLDLPMLDGGRFSLRGERGHPVLVSFLRHAG